MIENTIRTLAWLLAFQVCGASLTIAAPQLLRYSKPAENWEQEGLPIGNGSLGAVLTGDAETAVMQFNVDSLWTGDENPDGKYDDFGLTNPRAMGRTRILVS